MFHLVLFTEMKSCNHNIAFEKFSLLENYENKMKIKLNTNEIIAKISLMIIVSKNILHVASASL